MRQNKDAAIVFVLIGIIVFAAMTIMNPVYAVDVNEPETGLTVGQWVKYKPAIRVDGEGDMKKILEPLEQSMKDQFAENSGYSVDDTEWVKYTVADVSGTAVTFDRTVKLTSGSEMKLEPRKLDLAEFDPMTFFAMPTNLEFGSRFDGDQFGEVIFSKIDDDQYGYGIKSNVFTSFNTFSNTWKPGVVENVMEYEVTSLFRYDQKTGILLSTYKDVTVTNTNTHESGWVDIEVYAVDYPEDMGTDQKQKRAVNDRDEILEKLSEYFVEVPSSEFVITNEFVSLTEPKITTYDIIRVKDGTDLGVLKLYGSDRISSVSVSTMYSGDARSIALADRVAYDIMSRLTNHPVSTDPFTVLSDNKDKGEYHSSETYDDVNVSFSWIETNAGLTTGIFTQKITYLNEPTEKISEIKTQSTESSNQQQLTDTSSKGGGCLIATAAYGSELSPQVQQLRELRDSTILNTKSGTVFMTAFNQFYYSFSPTVADFEREQPIFKEAVKVTLTPMLTTLSILNYVDIDSEQEMLGYGIGIILMNVGMYIVAPAVVISKARSRLLK